MVMQGEVSWLKKYILIVDDDPDLVETVAMMLETKGYEVGKAYDGIEGEEAIKKRRPDVLDSRRHDAQKRRLQALQGD